MDADQVTRFRWGCAGLMLLCMVGMYAYVQTARESMYEEIERSREEPAYETLPPATPAPPRPKSPKEQMQALSREQKFGDALELGRTFLKNGPDDARASALEEMPRVVSNQYQFFLREKAWGRAKEMLQEMASLNVYMDGDGSADSSSYRYQLQNMQDNWRTAQSNRLNDAIKAGNDAIIDGLLAEIWDDPNADVQAHTLEEYLMKRWKAARDASKKDEAERLLLKASEVAAGDRVQAESWGFQRGRVEDELRPAMSGEELLAEGKRALENKRYVLACTYLFAFREPANIKVPSDASARDAYFLERLQRRLLGYEALLGLVREARAGTLRFLKPSLRENQLEIMTSTVCFADREIERFDKRAVAAAEKYKLPAEAWALRLEIGAKLVSGLLAEREYERVEREAESLLGPIATEYYLFQTRRLGADRWQGVPAALRAKIEKTATRDEEQVRAIEMALRKNEWAYAFPGADEVDRHRASAMARNGIKLLDRNPGDAYRVIREVLRRWPDSPMAKEARDAVFAAIRSARDKQDFNKLYDHAGFFIGEMGPQGAAPDIREELANCLRTAADYYKTQSPMKRAFMLSLLADVLAGDPRGQTAAEEASTLGFNAVASLPVDKPRSPDLVRPSGLPGLSVVAIENATIYHILVFFDGPEKFFVRVNPMRRGCAVLKDGRYTNAVIVTSDTVRPYKAEDTYTKQYAQSRYVVVTETSTGQRTKSDWNQPYGPFQLLRATPGSGPFSIDEETGIVVPKQ